MLETIGVCDSVKGHDPSLFQDLLDVLQRHPRSQAKLQGMKDISIQRNKLNIKAYEIYIMKGDCVEDMS